jgi:hypothetical protein
LDEQFVRHKMLTVATNIAEVKGAAIDALSVGTEFSEDAESAIKRIRSKLAEVESFVPDEEA